MAIDTVMLISRRARLQPSEYSQWPATMVAKMVTVLKEEMEVEREEQERIRRESRKRH